MGGECYHYMRCRKAEGAIPQQAKDEYSNTVLPELKNLVDAWWSQLAQDDKNGWTVRTDHDGIFIDCPRDKCGHFDNPICLPAHLDKTLAVGWQHRRYGNCIDPKEEIAEILMHRLKASRELMLLG
ncbi:hypothetical protein HDV05_002341 [Chytridiales sp. JEL 0842]|nr:hypothetical protein HDV05_002341 [Chytridiales sp. JEL 0842]